MAAPTRSETPLGARRARWNPATRKSPSPSATRPTRRSPATRTKGDQTWSAADRDGCGATLTATRMPTTPTAARSQDHRRLMVSAVVGDG